MERTQEYSQAPTFEQIMLLFKETDKKFQETDRKFQETDSLLSSKFQETNKRIKELASLFTTQWGKLVESLVEPGCLKLFQSRGIKIEQSFRNVIAKHGKKEMECDILLVNTSELVVVEVKTTCRTEDVTYFTEKLKDFKRIFPQYAQFNVYGAIAGLKFEGQSDKFAYRNGLFVIKCSGEGITKIVNDLKFKPKEF